MATSTTIDGDADRLSSESSRLVNSGSAEIEQSNGLLPHLDEPHVAKESVNAATRSLSNEPSMADKDNSTTFPSRRLQYSSFVVYLTIGYVFLATFAWAITCVLAHRPISAQRYGLWLRENDASGYYYPSHGVYEQSERWFQATRVLQAIVAVATIPLTSTICSAAAVVYMQRKCRSSELSLRQTIVLADRGWTDFDTLGQLLRGHWQQYGSLLLYCAIALHLLGAVLAPLQSIFVTTTSVQTPSDLGKVVQLTDLTDSLSSMDRLYNQGSDSYAAATLRALMTATSSTALQSRLWSASGAPNCTGDLSTSNSSCAFGQVSLVNISALEDPFLAQLPAGYNTGLVRQFIPRINSSATRERVDPSAFPSDCDYTQTFFANYTTLIKTGFVDGEQINTSWHLVACMPGNQTQRPANWTRARQDFSEELYLNLSAWGGPSLTTEQPTPDEWSGLFKITLNTTIGYFELPNYMNGQVPGPLLYDDPSNHCGRDCILQGDLGHADISSGLASSSISPRAVWNTTGETNGTTTIPNAAFQVNGIANKGPLLTTALALFGPDSFIADRVVHPENYINTAGDANSDLPLISCIDRMPFASLLQGQADTYSTMSTTMPTDCISNSQWNFGQLETYVVLPYVQMFIDLTPAQKSNYRGPSYDQLLVNAFNAAAFLANEQWLTSQSHPTLTVSYDMGAPIQKPQISRAGMILVSTLLAIYLVSLLAMALYSNSSPHWTSRLDSLAMMQLGATIAEHLPLNIIGDSRKIRILDESPGWIGDASDGNGSVGELAMGAREPLVPKRRYRCFEHDHEVDKEGRTRTRDGRRVK